MTAFFYEVTVSLSRHPSSAFEGKRGLSRSCLGFDLVFPRRFLMAGSRYGSDRARVFLGAEGVSVGDFDYGR